MCRVPDRPGQTATLGHRVALTLGMLGSPMTTSELLVLAARALESPVVREVYEHAPAGAEAVAALEEMVAGGVSGIRRDLESLERRGMVRRQRPAAANESHLWWRLPPAEWP